jgi:23S rRNA (adenine1618-N6)-methyltransferase
MIQPNDSFDFSVCNPPFNSSKEEALKGSIKKHRNLGSGLNSPSELLNFEGQANELWCNGGEALFMKRLIKESLVFKKQVKVFSSLISKSESITVIEKTLKKAGANHLLIPMKIGNKMSRIVVWWF